jgi:hypothetical protein
MPYCHSCLTYHSSCCSLVPHCHPQPLLPQSSCGCSSVCCFLVLQCPRPPPPPPAAANARSQKPRHRLLCPCSPLNTMLQTQQALKKVSEETFEGKFIGVAPCTISPPIQLVLLMTMPTNGSFATPATIIFFPLCWCARLYAAHTGPAERAA